MSKIGRTVNVRNEMSYLNLGDLRALVALCEGLPNNASVVCDEYGDLDQLRVEEIPEDTE